MNKKLFVTFVCFDLLTGSQDKVFQYEVNSEAEAMELFEKEVEALAEAGEGEYEINETFIEEITE